MMKKSFVPSAQDLALLIVAITTKVALLMVAAALTLLIGATALIQMWDWFALPFFGVTAPSIPQAMGMLLMVQLLRIDTKKAVERMHDADPEGSSVVECLRVLWNTTFSTAIAAGILVLIGAGIHAIGGT